MTTLPRPAVHALPGREADHRVTLAQVGRWRLASIGARDIVHDDRNGMLWFRVLSGNPYRKIIILLRADDTYAVEIGRMKKIQGLPEYVTEHAEGLDPALGCGLYGDQLGDAIDRLIRKIAG